jgi:hypothetical protein
MHFRERKGKSNKENNLMRNIFDGNGMITMSVTFLIFIGERNSEYFDRIWE